MTIRVLVVDDSAVMRRLITRALTCDPEIEVVGAAGDPYEARRAIKSLNPDVITLDIEMPQMNGIEFLEKIMRLRPTPVIMVSTLTHKGANAAIKALSLGAVDCLGKPVRGDFEDAFSALPALVKTAATARLRPTQPSPSPDVADTGEPPQSRATFQSNNRIIAIGSSTGGVEALSAVLPKFPENCPPTVIVQHMPGLFTSSFSKRLNRNCKARVEEAVDGAPLETGKIYLAPGDIKHMVVEREKSLVCRLVDGDPMTGHRPSVDVLFNSVAKHVGKRAVGVILTGMGRDGAAGLLAIRNAGGVTIGQDEKTSVIYGMPKVAHEMKAVERQYPLPRIADAILRVCNRASAKEAAA